MAQGFKPAKASSSKSAGGKAKAKGKAQPKTGARLIAPKKQNAIREAAQKQRNTASITKRIEADMAGRAMKGGPLTIMRKAALEAEQINQGKKAGLKDGAVRAKATMRS